MKYELKIVSGNNICTVENTSIEACRAVFCAVEQSGRWWNPFRARYLMFDSEIANQSMVVRLSKVDFAIAKLVKP